MKSGVGHPAIFWKHHDHQPLVFVYFRVGHGMRLGTYRGFGMTLWRRIIVFKLCFKLAIFPFLLSLDSYAVYAQATSTSQLGYWNMQHAMSGITREALAKRGFAGNDPRTYSTLQGMSNTAAALAGGTAAATVGAITLAGITAPAWGTILLVAAVSSAVGIAVQLGVNGLINWLFRSDNKLDISGLPQPVSNCTLGSTFEYWDANINGLTVFACDGMNLAMQALHTRYPLAQGQSQQVSCVNAVTVISCSNANGFGYAYRKTGTVSRTCGPGTYLAGTECIAYTFTPAPASPAATAQSMQQAFNALTEAEKQKALNPQLVATMANSLWQQAAALPGYAGFPYPSSNPITTAEATAWRLANPTYWPTVGDFVTPRPTTTTTPSPWALPSNPPTTSTSPLLTTQPNPSVVNPATQSLTNLGPDPATPAPELEAIPTAQDILNPVLNFLPNHKSFAAPSQAGQCPTPTITLYGTHTLNAHCTIIDQNKSIIQAAMTFAWAAIALFIILSA